ncbi:MAG: hypothetical protein RLZ98_1571 [Pseudomonadota bacterium]|jgi:carbon monoxide dehydrogenase subunit G
MKLNGENLINAKPEKVWAALNDPEILKQAIPGCQSLEKLSDTEFKAKVGMKIGPVQATFNGQVELSDLDPPNGYTISGSGSGGAAGNAKGGAKVRLEPVGDNSTRLTYDVDAQVTGKLAQLGSRLIDSTAKMLAGQFFNKFEKLVSEPEAEPAHETTGATAGGNHAAREIRSTNAGGAPTWAWLVGAALLAIVATYLIMGR